MIQRLKAARDLITATIGLALVLVAVNELLGWPYAAGVAGVTLIAYSLWMP